MSPTLKSVMHALEKSMADLSRGIFYENFELIGTSASKIANHPKPKSQLPTIIKTLNDRMKTFKKIDSKVHSSAVTIIKMAKEKNIHAILNKYQIMIKNCVSCHSLFRKEVSQALL